MAGYGFEKWYLGNVESSDWIRLRSEGTWNEYECDRCNIQTQTNSERRKELINCKCFVLFHLL